MADLTLTQALAELPETADGIAFYLTEQQCRGMRRRTDCCPVANYLKGTGEFPEVDVDPSEITAWAGEDKREEITTPPHVADFIRRFDNRDWPGLILPEEPDDV